MTNNATASFISHIGKLILMAEKTPALPRFLFGRFCSGVIHHRGGCGACARSLSSLTQCKTHMTETLIYKRSAENVRYII